MLCIGELKYNELKSRIAEPQDKIQVLSGPRQVGKTTLVKQVLQEIDLPYIFVRTDIKDVEDLVKLNSGSEPFLLWITGEVYNEN